MWILKLTWFQWLLVQPFSFLKALFLMLVDQEVFFLHRIVKRIGLYSKATNVTLKAKKERKTLLKFYSQDGRP